MYINGDCMIIYKLTINQSIDLFVVILDTIFSHVESERGFKYFAICMWLIVYKAQNFTGTFVDLPNNSLLYTSVGVGT